MTAEPAVTDTSEPPAGLADPRLLAWRSLLADAGAAALRRYQHAWGEPNLDEVGRAVAAIGALDAYPGPFDGRDPALPDAGPLGAITNIVGLDAADEAVLAAAWWAAVDPQVAVMFGCLHDDATRRYPTLGALALLLSPANIHVPLAISVDHPLARAGLVDLVPDAATPLRLPPSTASLLAGQRGDPPAVPNLPDRLAHVTELAGALIARDAKVFVRSPLADDLALIRDAVAARLELPVALEPRSPAVARTLLRACVELPTAILTGDDELPDGAVFAGAGPDAAAMPGWHVLDVSAPSPTEAQLCWRSVLRGAMLRPEPTEIVELAGRLELSESGIAAVVDTALAAARTDGRPLTIADVSATVRSFPRHRLASFARRLTPATRLTDLVLASCTRDGLGELIAHARYSAAASAQLGLEGDRGRAVITLFHGPSGTGKTAAAEAVAAELDRDLWVVDLARVVSKWLGETQRNLDAVLTEAAQAGAVLLFDEADGLFGKRGEVTDARDRYANLEIDHLLQRVELHRGVVILTSNRPASLDEAFTRRIRISVRFDMPDHVQREQLWRQLLPSSLLAEGTDTAAAATEELSGAAIRSAVLAATVLAFADSTEVTDTHLVVAVRRELEKQKRVPTVRRGQR